MTVNPLIFNIQLADLMTRHRKAQNMQPADMAKALGMTVSSLYALEAGKTLITVERLFGYHAALPEPQDPLDTLTTLQYVLANPS